MFLHRPPPIIRLSIGGPAGEPPRQHPKQPHPPSRVAQARHLVETTGLTYRIIAERVGVDKGTISRWRAKHGWTRPPSACPSVPRPNTRYVPVVIGRVLATRLRIRPSASSRGSRPRPRSIPSRWPRCWGSWRRRARSRRCAAAAG